MSGAAQGSSRPQIIEAFNGYDPSFAIAKLVQQMLREVPPKILAGLHSIVLTNVAALSRRERKTKGLGRERAPLEQSRGYYTQAWKGGPARITLLVDNIEEP